MKNIATETQQQALGKDLAEATPYNFSAFALTKGP